MLMRYAEDVIDVSCFPKVRIRQDMQYLSGPYAKTGAVGYIVATSADPLRRRDIILFCRDSAHLVRPDAVGQCSLEVDRLKYERI